MLYVKLFYAGCISLIAQAPAAAELIFLDSQLFQPTPPSFFCAILSQILKSKTFKEMFVNSFCLLHNPSPQLN